MLFSYSVEMILCFRNILGTLHGKTFHLSNLEYSSGARRMIWIDFEFIRNMNLMGWLKQIIAEPGIKAKRSFDCCSL